MKYLQPNYFLGKTETVWYPPPRFIFYGRIGKKLLIVQGSHSVVQSLYSLKSSKRNLVGPGAQTGHQITVYSSQHFKFNENTKMSACPPSPSSLYACTQAYIICKCCSDSLKFIRTSTISLHLCLPQCKSAVPYPQFMGSCPLGRCSSRLLQYLRKLSTEELRTKLRTSLTSSTSLLIHITAWHLFPYHSAAYDGGSFKKQPHLPFSGSLWLRAVEKEHVGRGRESVMERCGISPCQPHLLLMPALSKWVVCRGEMHWCSFMSHPWFLSHRSNILYLIQDS